MLLTRWRVAKAFYGCSLAAGVIRHWLDVTGKIANHKTLKDCHKINFDTVSHTNSYYSTGSTALTVLSSWLLNAIIKQDTVIHPYCDLNHGRGAVKSGCCGGRQAVDSKKYWRKEQILGEYCRWLRLWLWFLAHINIITYYFIFTNLRVEFS